MRTQRPPESEAIVCSVAVPSGDLPGSPTSAAYTSTPLANIFLSAPWNDDTLIVSSPSENRTMTCQSSGCLRRLRRLVAVSKASNSGVDPPVGTAAARSAVNELRQSSAQTVCVSLPLNERTDTWSSGFHGHWEIS